jgi:hypothetical protein
MKQFNIAGRFYFVAQALIVALVWFGVWCSPDATPFAVSYALGLIGNLVWLYYSLKGKQS